MYKGVMQDVGDIFSIWPRVVDLAADVSAKADTVRKWKKFGRIPPCYWPGMIAGAERRGRALTANDLMNATTPKKSRRKREPKSRAESRAAAL